eukprot:Sspe_Gene.69760::Locus_41135_Transcript_1_5_Confidence_0.429_Length_1690::g.69760::m.69760/K08857/NEK1_4_5; NIMA (never in mitosis gene a)-related kinase 1/4/5
MSALLAGVEEGNSNEVIQKTVKEGKFAAILGEPGDTKARFVKTKKIGSGSHGDAILVHDRQEDRQCVAKVMQLPKMTQRDLRYAYSEIRCMSLLQHPNIVQYVADFQSEDSLLIVMEYADGGDLERQVKSRAAKDHSYFKEFEVLFIFCQLCLALDHVHGKKMLHRDLKTANIFLTSAGVVKLGDFGYSHEYAETVSNMVAGTFCGTPCYLAPELWNSKRYSKKADIWSLGVIFYEMLALKRPYFSPHMKELMAKILKEEFAPPPPHYSENMSDLCHFLLRKDPAMRPTIRQIFQVHYVQTGLKRLVEVVNRNQVISPTVKKQIEDNVTSVLAQAQRPPGAGSDPQQMKGHVQRAEGAGNALVWKDCFLYLDTVELRVYKNEKDASPAEVYSVVDLTNACPIAPQEATVDNVFGVFLAQKPHTLWFRCRTQQESNQWLDNILTIVGI